MQPNAQITVVVLKGPSLTGMQEIADTQRQLTAVAEKGAAVWLAIDMGELQIIASAAVGMLVGVRKLVKERRGRMVIFGVKSEALKRVMNATMLKVLFPIAERQEDLTEAFGRIPTMRSWQEDARR